mgnify:CR=1 FL=1
MLVYDFLKNLKNLSLNTDFEIDEDNGKLYEKEFISYKVCEGPEFIVIIFRLHDEKFKNDEQKTCHILLDANKIQFIFVGDDNLRKIPLRNIDLNTIGNDSTQDILIYGRVLQNNMLMYLTNEQIDKLIYLFAH